MRRSIAPWVGPNYAVLGTDGFGRSEARKELRRFFEVDAENVALAAKEIAASGFVAFKMDPMLHNLRVTNSGYLDGEISLEVEAKAIEILAAAREKLRARLSPHAFGGFTVALGRGPSTSIATSGSDESTSFQVLLGLGTSASLTGIWRARARKIAAKPMGAFMTALAG